MSAKPPIFAPRTVAWVVSVSVASFLLAFVLSAFGDELVERRTAGPDSYSFSAIGHRALAELLERFGLRVDRRVSARLGELAPSVPLLLLEPEASQFIASWDDAVDLVDLAGGRDAPVVLALPKWSGVPDRSGRWLSRATPLPRALIERRLNDLLGRAEADAIEIRRLPDGASRTCIADDESAATGSYVIDVDRIQLLSPSAGLVPVVSCDERIVLGRVASEVGPPIWIVADPDLLNNHGIARGDHALLIRDLFIEHLGAEGVVFEETTHGHGVDESLVAELLSFPLILPVLHGLIAIGAIIWAGAIRFGTPRPPRPPLAEGKLVLIDNAAQLLALGGHSAESIDSYFQRTIRTVAGHYALRSDTALERLVDQLQRISDARGVEISLQRIRERIRGGAHRDDRAVQLARHLHRWRKEMLDGPRRDS